MKKILICIIAILILFSMTACGGTIMSDTVEPSTPVTSSENVDQHGIIEADFKTEIVDFFAWSNKDGVGVPFTQQTFVNGSLATVTVQWNDTASWNTATPTMIQSLLLSLSSQCNKIAINHCYSSNDVVGVRVMILNPDGRAVGEISEYGDITLN